MKAGVHGRSRRVDITTLETRRDKQKKQEDGIATEAVSLTFVMCTMPRTVVVCEVTFINR